jgi:hypothetical protein
VLSWRPERPVGPRSCGLGHERWHTVVQGLGGVDARGGNGEGSLVEGLIDQELCGVGGLMRSQASVACGAARPLGRPR